MVSVDDRTGSAELIPDLKRKGVPVEITRLEYGDVAFIGNGPDGAPITVGVEVKKVADVLKCITDGRFAGHQLPGLVQAYAQPWLLIEGRFRPDIHSGILQHAGNKGFWHDAHIGNRCFMYRDLDHWLMTMQFRGGIRVVRTYDRNETAQWLSDLYHWWNDKEWDEHRSHLVACDNLPDKAMLVRPSLCRRVAAELPSIGWEKSAAVARHYGTVHTMANAEEATWREIEGIGPIIAMNAYKALRTKG